MKPIDEFVNKIICGDSLNILKEIPDDSINLVITSPPYFGCRVYGDETLGRESHPLDYIKNLFEFTKEIKIKVMEDTEITSEASCNKHGSKGPATHRITVK